MSAYIVEDRTINRIVSYFNLKVARDSYYWPNRMLKDAGYDMSGEPGCQVLAQEMFKLNVQGVDARYGEGESAKFRSLDFVYRFTLSTSRIVAYKALECWRYQCSEGNVPQSALYQTMTEVLHQLAIEIVSDTTEYKQAKWG